MTDLYRKTPQRGVMMGLGLLTWLSIGLVLVIGCLLVINPTYTFRVTEADLQREIDARLPFETDKGGLRVKVEPGAVVDLLGNDRVRVELPAFSAYPPLAKTSHFEGSLVLEGTLHYANRAFYLRDVQVEELDGEWTLSDRAKVAGNIARNLLEKLATREGEDNSALERLTDPETLKGSATGWVEEQMVNREVYRLQGQSWMHTLLGASLENVSVTENDVVAELGLRGLLTYILLVAAIGLLAIAMVVGLVMSGGRGLGALLFFGAIS